MKTKGAKCIHCGKEIYAMTDKHVLYLRQAHELRCPQKTKGELHPVDSKTGDASVKETK